MGRGELRAVLRVVLCTVLRDACMWYCAVRRGVPHARCDAAACDAATRGVVRAATYDAANAMLRGVLRAVLSAACGAARRCCYVCVVLLHVLCALRVRVVGCYALLRVVLRGATTNKRPFKR